MTNLKQLLLISMILALLSCEEDLGPCSNVYPPSPTIEFTLMDSLTDKSLIGPDRLYHPVTIIKLNSGSYPMIDCYSDSIVMFNYGQYQSGAELPYRLSRTEYDTLQFEYEVVEGECFTKKNVTQFYYNGKPVSPQDYVIQIQK